MKMPWSPLLLILCLGSFFLFNCSYSERKNLLIEATQIESLPFEIEIDSFINYTEQIDFSVAYDPFFGEGTIFQGFSVKQGLLSMGADKLSAIDSLEIVFLCKDGYAPSMPLRDFFGRESFILPQKESELINWPEKVRPKVLPYYITFGDGKKGERLPFPYGVVKIKIDYSESQHRFSFPYEIQSDSLLSKGFKLFQHRCGKCHSINKEGGNVGPELNYPQNITEYRSKEYITSFVRNPQSYRYNSTMGSMNIRKEDLELIYQYISAMKEHKID